jgi:hypothetical protein
MTHRRREWEMPLLDWARETAGLYVGVNAPARSRSVGYWIKAALRQRREDRRWKRAARKGAT